MYFKCITASVLALCMSGSITAQEKSPAPSDKKIKKEEDIVIRKKGNRDEKTIIVVDGDKITVNGKDVDELHDSDLQVLRRDRMTMIAPRIRERIQLDHPGMLLPDNDFNFSFSTNRAVLGVMSEKNDKGARITEITKESPAAKAGLQKGDIITKVGDNKIEGPDDLYTAIGKYKPEDKVNINYLREGNEKSASATLGKNSENRVFNFRNKIMPPQMEFDMPRIHQFDGIPFVTLRPKLGMQVQDLDNGKGVKVLEVNEDAPAAKAGLQKDDIVTAIDGKEVKSVQSLREKVRDLKEGDSMKVTYERNGKTQTAEVGFPKKLRTADL